MEWNLSTPAAAVIMTGMGLVFGSFVKFFPKKETSVMESIKGIIEKQGDIMENQNDTLLLMKQKINGSHEKLDLVHRLVMNTPKTEGRIDEIWKSTVKD